VSLPPLFSSLLSAFAFLISLIMGYFLCRSPISVDLLLKPPPAVTSEETESLAPRPLVQQEDAQGGCRR
jgi:hypothetical protein